MTLFPTNSDPLPTSTKPTPALKLTRPPEARPGRRCFDCNHDTRAACQTCHGTGFEGGGTTSPDEAEPAPQAKPSPLPPFQPASATSLAGAIAAAPEADSQIARLVRVYRSMGKTGATDHEAMALYNRAPDVVEKRAKPITLQAVNARRHTAMHESRHAAHRVVKFGERANPESGVPNNVYGTADYAPQLKAEK